MTPIIERATPKLNLTLRVLGRRPTDGYHELESLVAFATDITDIITLTLGDTQSVTTTGPFAGSLAGENLVLTALNRVHAAAPQVQLGTVTLAKNLPIAAGIGGGSADAAALLRAIQRANANNPDTASLDWHALAESLGADVPVCLASCAQVMRGVGEHLIARPPLPALAAVLVNPRVPVPADKTAQVFRRLAAGTLASPPSNTPALETVTERAELLAVMRAIGNDLTPPARTIVPAIDTMLAALEASPNCELAQMSGGGPTCFGIYPDMAAANTAATHLSQAHPTWWIRASRLA
jgi:4-diphosphocytidyl-2-C-methyl-D-erythritol kinase